MEDAAAAGPAPAPEALAVAEDGMLLLHAGRNGTFGFPPVSLDAAGEKRWFNFEAEGVLHAVDLNVTWPSAPTGSTRLRATFGPTRDIDTPVWTKRLEPLVVVEGPSPLRIHVEDADLRTGQYALTVTYASEAPVTLGARQEFRVEGTLTRLLDAAAG